MIRIQAAMGIHVQWKIILSTIVIFICFGKAVSRDDYGLWHKTLTPRQAHACDDEELNLRCSPQTVISVHYVFYGRRERTEHLCPGTDSARPGRIKSACDSPKALQVIHKRCHKHMLCRLHVSPGTFAEDPCPGVRKYVEVMYKCRPETFLNRIVCEDEPLNLTCPVGQGLTIFSVTYGVTITGAEECQRGMPTSPSQDCLMDNADETVRSLCSGRERCQLRANDQMFGDPGCSGGRHLKVAFNCVEKELLLPFNSRVSEENIQTTSFPAWVRGLDQSTQNSFWPRNHGVASGPTKSAADPMQSDEVPTEDQTNSKSEDQRLVGLMSKLMSAHKYMTGNKEKLILYLSVSLVVGLLAFVSVLAGRWVIMRVDARRNNRVDITPETEDQFFSDSDLEHYEPAAPLPPPPMPQYTASMKRHDSATCPKALLHNDSDHFFT